MQFTSGHVAIDVVLPGQRGLPHGQPSRKRVTGATGCIPFAAVGAHDDACSEGNDIWTVANDSSLPFRRATASQSLSMAHLASTTKQLAFGKTPVNNTPTETPAAGLAGPEDAVVNTGKEIKLWDRSVIPLNATSATHDDFQPLPLPEAPPPATRTGYTPNPHKLDTRTTTADAYQAWPIEYKIVEPPKSGYQPSPHKFEATSVTHDHFKPLPLEPVVPATAPRTAGYTPNPHKLESRTTTADAYQAYTIERPPPTPSSAGYQPSPYKFEATSVTHDHFKALPLPATQPPATKTGYTPNPHKLDGRTTTADAYQAWHIEKPPAAPAPPPYQQSPHKFEGVSVTHDAYQAWPLETATVPYTQQSPRATGYTPNPHKLEGRTTTADAFQAYQIERPPPTPTAPAYMPSPHRFDGTTQTHDDFQAPPPTAPPPPPPTGPGYTPNPHKLESRTTTSDAYKAIPLPRGVQALGVEIEGGKFHALIPAGTYPPATGSAVVTTTHDNQTAVVIKVLAIYGGEPFELGAFELGGISPTLTGVPQVLVTFELDSERVLVVTAVDHSRGTQAGLTIKNVTVPPAEIS